MFCRNFDLFTACPLMNFEESVLDNLFFVVAIPL